MIGRRNLVKGAAMSWWASGNARQPQGPQAREAARLDRRVLGTSRAGTGPAPSQNIIRAQIVIIGGAAGGLFVYNGTPSASNPPILSITSATKDPFGNTVTPLALTIYNPQGAVIYDVVPGKDAWFLYADTGSATQGALVVSAASAAGTDGFGNTFKAGLNAYIVSSVAGSVGTWAINLAALGAGALPGLLFQNLTSPQNLPPSVIAAGSASTGAGIQINSGKGVSTAQSAFLFVEDSTLGGPAGGLIGNDAGEVDFSIWTGSSYNVVAIITRDAGGIGFAEIEGYIYLFNLASSPVAPAAGVALYSKATTVANSPFFKSVSGLEQNVSGSSPADFTNFTVTLAALTQCSKAWTIPANDANVGTTYRMTLIGNGTQGATQQDLIFQISGVAGSAVTINHVFAGVSATFNWKIVMEIAIKATGATGTAEYSVSGIAGQGANTGFTQAAINTASAFTFEAQAKWSSTVGLPTMTCFYSYLERIGP